MISIFISSVWWIPESWKILRDAIYLGQYQNGYICGVEKNTYIQHIVQVITLINYVEWIDPKPEEEKIVWNSFSTLLGTVFILSNHIVF